MNGTTIGLDQTEGETLSYEISDEALEAAAGNDGRGQLDDVLHRHSVSGLSARPARLPLLRLTV